MMGNCNDNKKHSSTRKQLAFATAILIAVIAVRFLNANDKNDNLRIATQQRQTRRTSGVERKLNIVSFGGSVTWGATLQSRDESYPSLIGNDISVHISDNLAIRATGAFWPATCIQSMLKETTGTDMVEYDVIILEFSVSGIHGLDLLLQRIRRRYPNALIIYVDLYSNRRPGWSNCVGAQCHITHDVYSNLRQMIKNVDGKFIPLPRPDVATDLTDVEKYFSDDQHHLNSNGHLWVRDQILNSIKEYMDNSPTRRTVLSSYVGDWLGGDSCMDWFSSGNIPTDLINIDGGEMKEFSPSKFAWEISDSAEITIDNNDIKGETPLIFVFMTKGNPSKYPYLQVNIDDNDPVYIDPNNKRWFRHHVTYTQSVGYISPGSHLISTLVTKSTEYPFRLVGITTCAACQTLNYDTSTTCRKRECIEMIDDTKG